MGAVNTEKIRAAQRNELTEAMIYRRLAQQLRGDENRALLTRIAEDEQRHHDLLAAVTGSEVRPKRWIVMWYLILARLLGVTFALKLMERGEQTAQVGYQELSDVPGIDGVIADEEQHENDLINMLNDERLDYAGSVVLGLNDALVELTGALAGLTLALSHGRLVAMAGLVTGIAASLSMAASEYLSSKSELAEGSSKSPLKASVYTGTAYIMAVILLILPYFLCSDLMLALALTLSVAVVIIALFNGYLSIARDLRFWPRFAEMTAISLGVAALSFGIGYLVRHFMGLEGI